MAYIRSLPYICDGALFCELGSCNGERPIVLTSVLYACTYVLCYNGGVEYNRKGIKLWKLPILYVEIATL